MAELNVIVEEKEETDRLLEKAKEQENLLQIPVADVRMTDIELGGGSYGGCS